MLAEIVGICAAGHFADTRGLAAPFGIGAVAFAAGLVGAGSAASMPALIAARIVQGCGAGAVSALAYTAVARGYPAEAKPRMLALLSTAWVAPGLIGPALAGVIAQHVGWRWVFLALAPLMLVAACMVVPALRALPRPERSEAGSTPVAAAFGLAIGGTLALEALRWTSGIAVAAGLIAAGAAALPSLQRLLPAGTLTARPGQPAAVAATALLGASFFGAEVFVPLALTDVRLQTTSIAGLVLTAATVAWTGGAWLQERIVLQTSRRWLTAIGLAAMAVGIGITSSILADAVPPLLAVGSWGLAGFGIGIAYSTVTLVVLEEALPGEEGSASAASQLAFVVGTAVGTGSTGAVVSRWVEGGRPLAAAIAIVFVVAVVLAVFALIVAWRLPGRLSKV
jgi:MFS family permease